MAYQTIVIMGPAGSGKSTFITALVPESSSFIQVTHDLQPGTTEVQHVEWVNDNGARIKLVDTPGFDPTLQKPTDVDILAMVAAFLQREYRGQRSKLAGLIYMHRISDTRVGEALKQNIKTFSMLCGQDSLRNVVIATTMWDKVTPEEGQRREQELLSNENLFKLLVDEGAVMYRHDSAQKSALAIVDYLLGKGNTTTVRELVHERRVLGETEAAKERQGELCAALQTHQRELEALEIQLRLLTAPVVRREVSVQRWEVRKKIFILQQQLGGLEWRSDPHAQMPTSALVGGSVNHPSTGDTVRVPYAPVVPPDSAHYPDVPGPSFVDQRSRQNPQPSPTSFSPSFRGDSITCCIHLLQFIHRIQKISGANSNHNLLMGRVIAWARDFANVVEKSLEDARSGSVALLQCETLPELQNLVNGFSNAIRDTLGHWSNSYTTMTEMRCEYKFILLGKPRGGFFRRDKVTQRFDVVSKIVEVMKELLENMSSTVQWWTSIRRVLSTWDVSACILTSEQDFKNVKHKLTSVITELESYHNVHKQFPEVLRTSADSAVRERDSSGEPVIGKLRRRFLSIC